MTRQSGCYWVKRGSEGGWEVARYIKETGAWLVCGDGCDYLECEAEYLISEINETRILAPGEVSDE